MNLKNLIPAALVLALVLLTAPASRAQPGSGGPQPSGGPVQTPIDGGASLLLAGGAAYGWRRRRAAWPSGQWC